MSVKKKKREKKKERKIYLEVCLGENSETIEDAGGEGEGGVRMGAGRE